MKHDSLLEAIGNTPLIRLNKLGKETGAEILVKLERCNPSGSIKDRVALAMIEDAERRGILKSGSTIVEPTSGNTGIGLAMVAAVKGYRAIFTMPDSMSIERRKIISAFGAEIVLTPAKEGVAGAVSAAERIARETPNSFMPDQFSNPANPEIHVRTTAREILADAGGRIDAFSAGIGTGGTLTGIARALKQANSATIVAGVEPLGSAILSGGAHGSHAIEGIGDGFVPDALDRSVMDRVIVVSDGDAISTARELARKEGIFAGVSSGANVWAAIQLAKELGAGSRIATVAPDSGERYLSTALCEEAL